MLLGGWLLLAAGQASSDACGGRGVDRSAVPAALVPLFERAAVSYELGVQGPAILAALTKVESDFGRDLGPSSAGAVGWTQFLPSTWRTYGVDADGDGRADPRSAADAIHAAARYLRALGAPRDWRRALFGYNHADWYVDRVLDTSRRLGQPAAEVQGICAWTVPEGRKLVGGGRIVEIPGSPGESIDERLVKDVLLLRERFHLLITDGYAASGHAADGEHPLGLAVDVVPGPGGSWGDVDALARWAEPSQGRPRPPFRWVGYDGDRGHGRGDHLHLSWRHADAPSRRPPAAWVEVLVAP
ncbi:MAG: lytic transglycosylase domain-containing protein [Solirubrobacterales bacterium]|nr:lytic transglycosylase domain-containing protein [Solirubrobacterales bacterium]